MTVLLDASVLIALSRSTHVHYEAAHRWRREHRDPRFATCPITEGALVRWLLREGDTAARARQALELIASLPGHEFWPDEIPYTRVDLAGVVGHRQVIDAYLAQLARERGARLVTLDDGLAALHHDVAMLIPTP